MSERRPTVLFVDDEPAILNSLRRVFMDEPWETLFAGGGEEGLAVVASRDVDLVLADFRMPGMDGVAFLKRVKAIRPDCLRVVLSGYADINLIVAALNEGQIYRFLSKPWNDDELRDHVRKFLDHQRLDRENRRLNSELVALNLRLEQKIEVGAHAMYAKERTLEYLRAVLEALPLALVCVGGDGQILTANGEARRLLRTGREAIERAIPAAVDGARASPTGCHVEVFHVAGQRGVVAAKAGMESLDVAHQDERREHHLAYGGEVKS
ncbi:MAG TPA: response regulator [Planctomycetota bacterium]|nr:response regulator [Planctomycetota bacterium]